MSTDKEFNKLLSIVRSRSCKPSDLGAFVDHTSKGLPTALVPEVVTLYCKHLDANQSETQSAQDASLHDRRQFAFFALKGLGNLRSKNSGSPSPSHPKDAEQPIIQRNWPQILSWMRYFCLGISKASFHERQLEGNIARTILVLIEVSWTLLNDEEFFKSIVQIDRGLLEVIIKMWWKCEKLPNAGSLLSRPALALLCVGLNCAISESEHWQGSSAENAVMFSKFLDAQSLTLRSVDADALGLAERVIGHFTNPAYQKKGAYENAYHAMCVINDLIRSPHTDVEPPNKFMIAFCQKELGRHAMRHLDFIVSDFEGNGQVIPASQRSEAVRCSVQFMAQTVTTGGSLHWTALLLKNGILRSVANLTKHAQLCDDSVRENLNLILIEFIPRYLVHRDLVLCTITALKEVSRDGSAKSLESSFLKDAWTSFSKLVLERAVFNALYKQSCVADFLEVARCGTCIATKYSLERGLNKCAGCSVVVYCSRECQKKGWNNGHRRECEYLKGTTQPEAIKYGGNNFLQRLTARDIRRHAVGIKEAIKRDKSLDKAPPRDIVLVLSYKVYPPTITPKRFQTLLEEVPPTIQARLLDIHPSLGSQEMTLYVTSCRGGPVTTQQPYKESFSLLDGPLALGKDIIPERDASTPAWAGTSMQSVDGQDLEFEFDEVDVFLYDAHLGYRSGSNIETIFDYVEGRIRAEEWVSSLDYLRVI